MQGAYVLLMELKTDQRIRIGNRGTFLFSHGWYLYVGSALNGLDQRIARHWSSQKKLHWHIDYLLQYAQITKVFYKENTIREECTIAQHCIKTLQAVPGFGCSDCSCISHLFFGSLEAITGCLDSLSLHLYQMHAKS